MFKRNSAEKAINPTRRALSPISAYRICPPSSCPIGIRLIAVTSIPIHPAKMNGKWYTSFMGSLPPPMTSLKKEKRMDFPKIMFAPPCISQGWMVSTYATIPSKEGSLTNPTNRKIKLTTNPATGPATPTSNSALRLGIWDLILIKAPIVPKWKPGKNNGI